jgi:hypothetical protein
VATASQVPELARRLAALPEQAMREAVLAEVLAALSPEDAAGVAGELVRRAPSGRPYDVALLALTGLLDGASDGARERDRLGYERRQAMYTAARGRGDLVLVRLLLSAHESMEGAAALEGPAIPGRPELTLGERKSLARTRRRDVLDRMLRDPDPSVLEILLGNPRVTEGDVVRLAARRPTTPEAQRTIFRADRFRPRYAVRRALVLNPYTPSDLAAQLVGLLTEPDLRRVETDTQLSDPVRAAARAQLVLAAALRRPPERD